MDFARTRNEVGQSEGKVSPCPAVDCVTDLLLTDFHPHLHLGIRKEERAVLREPDEWLRRFR